MELEFSRERNNIYDVLEVVESVMHMRNRLLASISDHKLYLFVVLCKYVEGKDPNQFSLKPKCSVQHLIHQYSINIYVYIN